MSNDNWIVGEQGVSKYSQISSRRPWCKAGVKLVFKFLISKNVLYLLNCIVIARQSFSEVEDGRRYIRPHACLRVEARCPLHNSPEFKFPSSCTVCLAFRVDEPWGGGPFGVGTLHNGQKKTSTTIEKKKSLFGGKEFFFCVLAFAYC